VRVSLNVRWPLLCLKALRFSNAVILSGTLCTDGRLQNRHKEATPFGGMLGFGSTLQLIGCGFRLFCGVPVVNVCGCTGVVERSVVESCCFLTPISIGKEGDTNLGLGAFGLSFHFGPDIRQDYPLNLSILISGGKETNKDSPSNGE
jgi:hypothetical protein